MFSRIDVYSFMLVAFFLSFSPHINVFFCFCLFFLHISLCLFYVYLPNNENQSILMFILMIRIELKSNTIDTVTKICRTRSIIKDMTEMCFALKQSQTIAMTERERQDHHSLSHNELRYVSVHTFDRCL